MQDTAIPRILVTLPSLREQGGVASFFNSIFPHIQLDITTVEIGRAQGKGSLLYPVTGQFRFRKTISRIQPTLIHLNPSLRPKSFFRDAFFAWRAKQMGLPVLVFWHGWNKQFEKVVEKHLMWFFRNTYGRADCFIVLASEFEQKLKEWDVDIPIYRETTIIEETLLEDFDLEGKLDKARGKKGVKVLFLARLEKEKGVFETVEAVKILLEKNLLVSLSIAGDGPVRRELERHVEILNLPEGAIRFLGYVREQDKINAFADHDIYCFPTFYGEGLPISVLEAMAFGMPVVTRPVGGLRDFFEEKKMGEFVPGKNAEDIAAAMEGLINDRNRMTEIGRYNGLYARKHFMAGTAAKRLVGIYKKTQLVSD